VAELRAACWALLALARLRRTLRMGGVAAAAVIPPPRVSAAGQRGVTGILRRRNATCLERALVLQRWYAAHGVELDVVIGVKGPTEGFAAHAWLDGDPSEPTHAFQELHRLTP
jgi:hypothetical protein